MRGSYKRGATVKALIEFTAQEWEGLWPWDSITATADQEKDGVKYPMMIHPLPETRSILLMADTSDWYIRVARIDVMVVKGAETIILPNKGYIEVDITTAATEKP